MRIISAGLRVATVICGLLITTQLLWSQGTSPFASVTVQDGKLRGLEGGDSTPVKAPVYFPGGIKVDTNASFTVQEGPKRKLQEGQVLSRDGMLTSPGGTIVPVFDHLAVKNGRVTVVKNGESSILKSEYPLPDGSKVLPNGVRVTSERRMVRLIDGQLIRLDGGVLPAKDTVSLKDGIVYVQKDGSQFAVPRQRKLTMNDGSRVWGSGIVELSDGTRVRLSEGEILTVPGVVKRK